MDDIVKINDLTFKYDDKLVFDNLNLSIKRNSLTTITGRNNCGKTTLIKILCGFEKFNGYINIDGINLKKDNLDDIRMKIGVVLDTNNQVFVGETVIDEIAFVLENLCYPKEDIQKEINRVSKLLHLNSILNLDPNNLTDENKLLVSLGCALAVKPAILILDSTFDMVDNKESLLKKLSQIKNMTIINFTTNPNDLLYSDEIIVLDKGKVVLKGNPEDVYNSDDIFDELGLEWPFMVDLSKKLQFYDLTDDVILDMDEMVDKLWK